VNALTGEDVLGKSPAGTVLQGVDLISGPSLGAYTLPEISNAIVLLDEFLQVRLGPDPIVSIANAYHRCMFTLKDSWVRRNSQMLSAN
jgi:hypothetical protein